MSQHSNQKSLQLFQSWQCCRWSIIQCIFCCSSGFEFLALNTIKETKYLRMLDKSFAYFFTPHFVPYIQKGGFRNPLTILNILQTDCLRIYALFPQILLDWKAESADFILFWMYALTLHRAEGDTSLDPHCWDSDKNCCSFSFSGQVHLKLRHFLIPIEWRVQSWWRQAKFTSSLLLFLD